MAENLLSNPQGAAPVLPDRMTKRKFQLYDALLSGKGLQHIVTTARKVFGNPIIMGDNGLKILAYSHEGIIHDKTWNMFVSGGSYEDVIQSSESGIPEMVEKNNYPFYLKADFHEHRWIVRKIEVGGKNIGTAHVLEYETAFDDSDLELFQLFCDIVSLELQRDPFYTKSRGIYYEYFIGNILNGKIIDPMVIQERIKMLGLKLDPHLFILTFQPRPDSVLRFPIEVLRNHLEDILWGAKCLVYNDSVVALLSRKNEHEFSLHENHKLISFLSENNMLLGISRSFSDVSEIRKFFLQSTKAIELGLRLSPRDTFFWYEDYNFYQLFEAASKAEEIDDFCKPVLWKIREYDQIHNTSHLDELEAYISADNDRLKSAQILHVHRNTMDYRINKINELFEIDVDDPEMKFSLNLSFRILRFLQSFKDLR